MNVGELKSFLADIPDNVEVVVCSDFVKDTVLHVDTISITTMSNVDGKLIPDAKGDKVVIIDL